MAADDPQLSAWILIGGSIAVGWWYWKLPQGEKLARLGRGGGGGGSLPAGSASDSGGGGSLSPLDELLAFASEWGLTVTSTTGGKHNPGSLHPLGRAIDVSVRGLTEELIARVKMAAASAGIEVIDERSGPSSPGAVWSGPHLHLQISP